MSRIRFRQFKFLLGGFWLLAVFGVGLGSVFSLFQDKVRYKPDLGINLIVVNKNGVAILALRPEDEPSSFVRLPSDLLVNAYGTSGEYRVDKLWQLGKLEKMGGEKMVAKSIGDALGFVAGGVIDIADNELIPEGILAGLVNPLSKTSLWWWDRLVLWRKLKEEKSAFSLLTINLPGAVYQREKEIDGVVVKKLDSESVIDAWGRSVWMMEGILEESAEVEILNYSDEPGKARQMARKLSNAGMRVIRVDKGEGQINEFVCEAKEKELADFSQSVFFLKDVLGCKIKPGESEVFLIKVK